MNKSYTSFFVELKVRNFMESTLIDLRNLWMKRLIFNACVQCCCLKLCSVHQAEMCPYDECIHFLNLDECLTNNIITCDYRRVKTMITRTGFQHRTFRCIRALFYRQSNPIQIRTCFMMRPICPVG